MTSKLKSLVEQKFIKPISSSAAIGFYGDTTETKQDEYQQYFESGFYFFVILVFGGAFFALIETLVFIITDRPIIYSFNLHGYLLIGVGTLFTIVGALAPDHWKNEELGPRITAATHNGLMIFISGLIIGIPTRENSIEAIFDRIFSDTQGLEDLGIGIIVFILSVSIPFLIIILLLWSIWKYCTEHEVDPLNKSEM